MSEVTLRRSFIALHLTLGLVVALEGARALTHALGHLATPQHGHLAFVAAIETAAALLLLWPRTMRVGGVGLLATFAAAIVIHALRGEFPATLLVYAAATLFVTVHGSAWRSPDHPAAA